MFTLPCCDNSRFLKTSSFLFHGNGLLLRLSKFLSQTLRLLLCGYFLLFERTRLLFCCEARLHGSHCLCFQCNALRQLHLQRTLVCQTLLFEISQALRLLFARQCSLHGFMSNLFELRVCSDSRFIAAYPVLRCFREAALRGLMRTGHLHGLLFCCRFSLLSLARLLFRCDARLQRGCRLSFEHGTSFKLCLQLAFVLQTLLLLRCQPQGHLLAFHGSLSGIFSHLLKLIDCSNSRCTPANSSLLGVHKLTLRYFKLLSQLLRLLFGGNFFLLCHACLLLGCDTQLNSSIRLGLECYLSFKLRLQLVFVCQTLLREPGQLFFHPLAFFSGLPGRLGSLHTLLLRGQRRFVTARFCLFRFNSTALCFFKLMSRMQSLLFCCEACLDGNSRLSFTRHTLRQLLLQFTLLHQTLLLLLCQLQSHLLAFHGCPTERFGCFCLFTGCNSGHCLTTGTRLLHLSGLARFGNTLHRHILGALQSLLMPQSGLVHLLLQSGRRERLDAYVFLLLFEQLTFGISTLPGDIQGAQCCLLLVLRIPDRLLVVLQARFSNRFRTGFGFDTLIV